eukprot:scaffold197322_cov28-Tisochrysis_lutea.AAC.2
MAYGMTMEATVQLGGESCIPSMQIAMAAMHAYSISTRGSSKVKDSGSMRTVLQLQLPCLKNHRNISHRHLLSVNGSPAPFLDSHPFSALCILVDVASAGSTCSRVAPIARAASGSEKKRDADGKLLAGRGEIKNGFGSAIPVPWLK